MSEKDPAHKVEALSQEQRVPCSLPLPDADLTAGNCNWTRGLQAMSDWIWSGNLNPEAFPNNLGRYLLQVPGIFEQQLNYSATLIFDEPSFKNGVQISGMVPRPMREMAISLTAQRRRCWYSLTHHAILGKLTSAKHGMGDEEYTAKWGHLADHLEHQDAYSRCERAVLVFADAFSTNPKAYTDEQYAELRAALAEENRRRHGGSSWVPALAAARRAHTEGLVAGLDGKALEERSRQAAQAAAAAPLLDEDNQGLVNSQVVELAFICLQFVALTDVFTGLNIPDEDFLPGVFTAVVPAPVVEKINALNRAGADGMADLLPPAVELPLAEILAGEVVVESAPLKGSRVPLVPYETHPEVCTRDKGVTVGGASIGTWGWSFGAHFPGGLLYVLMHHPELARFETAYSLPVLFNEDEWRNGVQTAGFTTRRLKEIIYQKVYRTLRSRYGLEHHTMFLLNSYLQEHGGGPFRLPGTSDTDADAATRRALERANAAAIHAADHRNAPAGTFTGLEAAAMDWVGTLLRRPHDAHTREAALREALDAENRREIEAGLRHLDTSVDGDDHEAALRRLQDHQIAEIAMTAGHMNGLGRALTILRVESEDQVQALETASDGSRRPTGYFQDRPGLLQILGALGLSEAATTVSELQLNPRLNKRIKERLAAGETSIRVSGEEAARTGEF